VKPFTIYLLILAFLFIIKSPLNAKEGTLSRLDPHGQKTETLRLQDIHPQSSCMACHIQVGKKVEVAADVQQRCFACHGKLPHSGLSEHLGKDLKVLKGHLQGKLNCLSCHFPHRGALNGKKAGHQTEDFLASSFLYNPESILFDKEKYTIKREPAPMLRADCIDCHNQANMK